MPLGTIALADLLEKNGYSAKIVHSGIEQIYDRDFQIEKLFKIYDPNVVGIDLHWYVHSYDAMRIGRIAKELSNGFVVLGGFTSSYFAEEIMSKFNFIDAVITGDAEIPLLELMKKKENNDFDLVPNLFYRKEGLVKHTTKKYIAGEEDLRQLDYTNFKLLTNYDKYHRVMTQAGDLDPYSSNIQLKKQAWVPLGRGCSVNCSYCGSGVDGHYILTGRNKPLFHPKEQVVYTLAKFEEENIDSIYMAFDPLKDRKYYHELFKMMREENIDISAQFELWSLSDKNFIQDFQRTFNPLYSTLMLSPESGSEDVREKNKGFYYSNNELFHWLNDALDSFTPLEIYFASGLSWETKENFEETINIAEAIIKDYPVVTMSCNPIQIEPGGLRYIQPDKYGTKPKWVNFMDYYNHFECRAKGLHIDSQIGYETIWQTEEQIIENSVRFEEKNKDIIPRWKLISDGKETLTFFRRTHPLPDASKF